VAKVDCFRELRGEQTINRSQSHQLHPIITVTGACIGEQLIGAATLDVSGVMSVDGRLDDRYRLTFHTHLDLWDESSGRMSAKRISIGANDRKTP